MTTETIPMFQDLPIDNPAAVKRPKSFVNMLPEMINRIMDHFGQEAVDIVTGCKSIYFSTLSGWINAKVETQLVDAPLKELAVFWGVTIDYLCFGTPMSERDFELDKAMDEAEEKKRTA